MKVLFDTNALMMPAQFAVDVFDEVRNLVGAYEPLVLDAVRDEIAGLSSKAGRDGAAARLGLSVADHCTTVGNELLVPMTADEQVVRYAGKHGCIVVTNDRILRRKLLDQGIGVISLRKQKRLELIQS